jgi:hypothetical protein
MYDGWWQRKTWGFSDETWGDKIERYKLRLGCQEIQ